MEGELTTLIGQELGGYRIISQIGKGGMATVYKAFQPSLDRYVAIKIMPPFYAEQDETFLKRFRREARSVAKLRHPNILIVIDYGEYEELTYIVMEYIDAGTLTERLGSPIPLQDIASIIEQVGGALDYAHAQGVVHRDVKPSNILLPKPNWPLLTDFGLAKIVGGSQLTLTGSIAGTPAYMSPEQGQGESVDWRSDIYSLGIVLYEMATGGVPFTAETPMAVVVKHIIDPLPLPTDKNPNLPDSVEKVILKALAKKAEDRYQKVQDLSRDLNACLADVGDLPSVPDTVVETSDPTVEPERIDIRSPAPSPAQGAPAPSAGRALDVPPPVEDQRGWIKEGPAPQKSGSTFPKWLIPAGLAAVIICMLGIGGVTVLGLIANQDPTEEVVPTSTAAEHVAAGREFIAQGLNGTAIEEFELAIELGSRDPDMYFELVGLYLDGGQVDNAVGTLDRLGSYTMDDPAIQEQLGWYYFDLEMFENAIGYFERTLELNPEAEWILDPLAESYRAIGDFDRADEILGVDVIVEDQDTYFYENAGWDYLYNGDYAAAEESFTRAIELDPNNVSGWDGLSDTYWYSSSYDQALATLDEAILHNPEYEWFYTKTGWIYLELENYDGAIGAFEQAIKVDPDWSTGYSGLADLYTQMGEYKSAVAILEQGLEQNPARSDLHSDLGYAYLEAGDFDSAINAFQNVVKNDPTFGWYYYDLATAYVAAGRIDEAVGSLEQAASLATDDDPWLYEAIGWEYIELNQCDAAVFYFESALELDPTITSAEDGIRECGG